MIALPRSVLRGSDEVVVVDAEGRLRIRRVEILRRERDRVLVTGGLRSGEYVCEKPLSVTVEGMEVRILAAAPVAGEALAHRDSRP